MSQDNDALREALKAADRRRNMSQDKAGAEWQPIETAPKDRLIEVFASEYEGLNAMISLCQWHPDAGFCVCELRTASHWREHNPPRAVQSSADGGSRG